MVLSKLQSAFTIIPALMITVEREDLTVRVRPVSNSRHVSSDAISNAFACGTPHSVEKLQTAITNLDAPQ